MLDDEDRGVWVATDYGVLPDHGSFTATLCIFFLELFVIGLESIDLGLSLF